MILISSLQNELIKEVVRLRDKAGERKKKNLIVIEGSRELSLAIEAGFEMETLLICSKLLKESGIEKSELRIIEVTEDVYAKIAYRENYDGVIALAKPRYQNLSEIKFSDNPLVIVLETVEKPGNLGAILRTADAAKVDAVIICDNQTDIYNPNIIRSSLGSIFTNQVVCCRNDEAFEFLKNNNIRSYATSLKAGKLYYDCDYNKASALLMGSEAKGLSPFWHEKADELIKIPMDGKVDSLNVSVSTAVVVFEAFRQRRSSTH